MVTGIFDTKPDGAPEHRIRWHACDGGVAPADRATEGNCASFFIQHFLSKQTKPATAHMPLSRHLPNLKSGGWIESYGWQTRRRSLHLYLLLLVVQVEHKNTIKAMHCNTSLCFRCTIAVPLSVEGEGKGAAKPSTYAI